MPEHLTDRTRQRVVGSQDMRMLVHLGIERQQESEIMRGGAEPIEKLGQEANDDHAGIEPGEIFDVMQLEIVHDEQVAGGKFDQVIAHAKSRKAIEREKELEPFVPGGAASVKPRCVAEELNDKRKLPV